jgi:hypothetical protein
MSSVTLSPLLQPLRLHTCPSGSLAREQVASAASLSGNHVGRGSEAGERINAVYIQCKLACSSLVPIDDEESPFVVLLGLRRDEQET